MAVLLVRKKYVTKLKIRMKIHAGKLLRVVVVLYLRVQQWTTRKL